MDQFSGWLWLLLGIIGVGGLGVAIAYGTMMWRARKKSAVRHRVRENITREHYQEP